MDGESETLIPTTGGVFSDAAIAIQGNLIGRDEGGPQGVGASEEGVMYTLTKADVHGVAQPIALQDVRGMEKAQNGRGWNDDGTAYTLDAMATQGVAQPIAMRESGHGYWMRDDLAGTLRAEGEDRPSRPSHVIGVAQPVAFPWQSALDPIGNPKNLSETLIKNQTMAVAHGMAVRRLTPTECERLQGFPDGYTDIPWKGKQAPDGPRYKALGNSWAVPVVRWIGERINQVEAL